MELFICHAAYILSTMESYSKMFSCSNTFNPPSKESSVNEKSGSQLTNFSQVI